MKVLFSAFASKFRINLGVQVIHNVSFLKSPQEIRNAMIELSRTHKKQLRAILLFMHLWKVKASIIHSFILLFIIYLREYSANSVLMNCPDEHVGLRRLPKKMSSSNLLLFFFHVGVVVLNESFQEFMKLSFCSLIKTVWI